MIIDPFRIVNSKVLLLAEGSKIQQSGIDVTIKRIREVSSSTKDDIFYEDNIELPKILKANTAYDFECNEYVKVPANAIALLIIRSTFNRRGAFITTGLYDNQFENFIGGILHTTLPIAIDKNERIGQIVFFQTEHTAKYEGQYNAKK